MVNFSKLEENSSKIGKCLWKNFEHEILEPDASNFAAENNPFFKKTTFEQVLLEHFQALYSTTCKILRAPNFPGKSQAGLWTQFTREICSRGVVVHKLSF